MALQAVQQCLLTAGGETEVIHFRLTMPTMGIFATPQVYKVQWTLENLTGVKYPVLVQIPFLFKFK